MIMPFNIDRILVTSKVVDYFLDSIEYMKAQALLYVFKIPQNSSLNSILFFGCFYPKVFNCDVHGDSIVYNLT